MIVEHTESFQVWLAKVLKPLCDADPGALAKYVLALIKKDKTEKELRQSMVDQLDVFLQSETKPFVDKLFEALNTKEYLNAKSSSSSQEAVQSSKNESVGGGGEGLKGLATAASSSSSSSSENCVKTEKPSLSSLSSADTSDPISSTSGPTASVNANQTTSSSSSASHPSGGNNEVASTSSSSSSKKGSNTLSVTPSALLNSEASATAAAAVATSTSSTSHADSKEDAANKTTSSSSSSSRQRERRGEDDRDKNRRKRSRTERDRRGSRSRSADRGPPTSKRSRSPRLDRERERDRDRNERPLRHRLGRKSPPPRRYDRDGWDRRRSRSPLGGRNRSCSPRNSNRSRSPPPPRYRRPFNSSRSRSRSPITRGGGDRSRSPRSRSRSPHNKDASKDASKKDSLLPIPPGLDADMAIKELAEKTPLVQSVVVRPGGAQGSHGSGGDSSQPSGGGSGGNNRCRDFDEKGLCMRGELCPFDHGKDPVVLEDIVVPGVSSGGPGGYGAAGRGLVPGTPGYNPPLGRPPAMIGEYYPDSPSLEPPVGWGPGAPPFRPRHMGFDAVAARGGRGGLLLRPSAMGPYPVPGGQRQLISVPVVGGGGIPPAPGVPVMGGGPHGVPPGMPPMPLHPGLRGVGMRGHRGGRGGFDHGRLGAKPSHHHHHHPHRNYTNCSLEVRKIPREQNTIMDLNSHFLRFGKIINIQINYDSDPEAALVTFSSPTEAQLAYRSTEAVLNNRFIRVFWHNKEKENEEEAEAAAIAAGALSGNAQNPGRIPVKERLGAQQTQDQIPMEHEKILLSGNNLTKTVYNNAALLNKKMETQQDKLQTVESIKRSQEMLAAQVTLKNLQDQKKAEALKMSNDLRRRQQTMMEEQIGQQKKLIAKLESGSLNAKEKEETLKVLKVLQDSVAKLKKDLDDSTPSKNQHSGHHHHHLHHQVIINNKKPVMVGQGLVSGGGAGATPRTKEEAQKEMLDAELDLINKEQQGGDTNDLQKKVLELRAQAKSLGLIGQGARGGGGGRGGFRGIGGRGFGRARGILRGRGRGSVRALRSVDRRPTKIRITGCPASRLSDILTHFSVFGPIRDYVSDANVPMMIVDFDSRKCAEVAMANGQMFEEIKLSLEWVTENAENPGGKPGSGSLLDVANNGESSNHHDDLDTSEAIDEDDMGDDELGAILDGSNEICLTGEDDDEDEDDRSWRR